MYLDNKFDELWNRAQLARELSFQIGRSWMTVHVMYFAGALSISEWLCVQYQYHKENNKPTYVKENILYIIMIEI